MSADLLRKAAEILRKRAEAATPGPWSHYPDTFRSDMPVHRLGSNAAQNAGGIGDVGLTPAEHAHGLADAAYIATMHPGVGLALADWLDSVARVDLGRGQRETHVSCDADCDVVRAATLARLIVGEDR
jgi:hypothetical protein